MRTSFSKPYIDFPLPNPIVMQLESYDFFLKRGIRDCLNEIGEIHDNTGRNWILKFTDYRIEKPNRTIEASKRTGLTYDAPWFITAEISKIGTKEFKRKEIYMGDLPLMGENGIFVINGVSKVVINQLARAQGIVFTEEVDKISGQVLPSAKILPKSGVWLDIETNKAGVIYVKIDRKRKIPITVVLRIFGLESDEEIIKAFSEFTIKPQAKIVRGSLTAQAGTASETNEQALTKDTNESLIHKTLEKDPTTNYNEAVLEVYKKLRPGDPVVLDAAKNLVDDLFFNVRRFSLGSVGRFKFNMTLGTDFPNTEAYHILQQKDLIEIVKRVIHLYRKDEGYYFDDIDSLSNRRIRSVGELLLSEMRYGFYQLERLVRERMALAPRDVLPDPSTLISPKPVSARIISYLASGQLSQLLGQYNPLDSLDHKRRLSVMGKGGLTKERASYAVRDAHPTHYGKIDCIRTPEGQNVGLVTYLALYARSNEYGFLETPYAKLEKNKDGKMKITGAIEYLASYDEEKVNIIGGLVEVDDDGYIAQDKVALRRAGHFFIGKATDASFIEVAPQQILGVSTALIPFIAHDDVARSLIAAQQSSQAVPLVRPEAPIVGTGVEGFIAESTKLTVRSSIDGVVDFVDAMRVVVKGSRGESVHHLRSFDQSNMDSCYTQLPTVRKGQKVKKGDLIAEGPCSDDGELALGVNLRAAFMVYKGYNFEDAFIISSRLVENDILSSVNISDYTIQVLETKLGPEEITADIPNVSEESLKHLDAEGVVIIGSRVKSGDILVGKIQPKGQSELSAEERLLRAVFGERVKDVKDSSLRLPHGRSGVVIDVTVLTPKDKEKMAKGVIKEITVKVAEFRKITIGDKLSGRHGQKGVIAKIMPKEDMPHLPNGIPMDVIISPSSILGRMNLGNVLEAHLGWAGSITSKKYAIPPFIKVEGSNISKELKDAGLPVTGKTKLIDGQTGEFYDQEVTVGMAYIFKLHHMAEDKMHARSTGPYSLITQQPLGGKAQFGGQRFGEMEVWALEAYGAAYTLHELLTIKSDDIKGRFIGFQAMIKGLDIPEAHVPESFKLLVRQLNGLCLAVTPIRYDNDQADTTTTDDDDLYGNTLEPVTETISKEDIESLAVKTTEDEKEFIGGEPSDDDDDTTVEEGNKSE